MKIYDRNYDYMDFETIKENWNFYDLEDGTILKLKIVLLKIMSASDGEQKMAFSTANLLTALSAKETRGTPSLPGTVIKIEKKDMPFKILAEEWNEYKLEDGKILKLKPTIIEISKGSHYDKYGEPNYLVQSQPLVKV